ncbi:MAG: VOC family protein [Proteiniphilum sp.]|uniref:VOC family protein n=1 Tax=Proteiniphilum sp. TaxID=1926877 RepID=UPI002B21CCBF|nr:VOC family protein [Proteiniphilum sp.]MEA5129827.1 VOC family protein [Proteiniphilum sp.]
MAQYANGQSKTTTDTTILTTKNFKDMNLLSTRIITDDVQRLVNFYEHITGLAVIQFTPDFAEFKTEAAALAIGGASTMQFFGGNEVAKAAQNRTVIVEFRVKDVDETYKRLEEFLRPYLVQKPTTMPWGNKSLLFRDPDGNLVNFFAPVTPEAIKRFDGVL